MTISRRARRAAASGAYALASVCVSSAAAAQGALPEMSWEAPAGCPQIKQVEERIRAIGGSPGKRETRLQAFGKITKEEGRFHLRLVVRDGGRAGERNIVSDSCEDLAGAAAVALGLLMRSEAPLTESDLQGGDAANAGPDGAGPAGSSASSASPPDPARTESTSSIEPTAAVSPTSSRRWQVLVRAPAVTAGFGPLPQPSLGLSLGAGVRSEPWRLLLAGALWSGQTVYGNDRPGYGADVGRASASLTVGYEIHLAYFGLAPCLTLALERITARGVGAGVVPIDQKATWFGAGAGVVASLQAGKAVALVAEVGARIETSRPLISIDGLGNITQLRPWTLTTALGAEWGF